jgi:hypothetical protein
MICAWDWCTLNAEGSVGQFNRYWHDLSEQEKEVSTVSVLTQIYVHKCMHRRMGSHTLSHHYPER